MPMVLYLYFFITKHSSDQFGVWPLAKMFLYFDILTWSSTINLGSLSLISLIKSIYILSLTSIGFILICIHCTKNEVLHEGFLNAKLNISYNDCCIHYGAFDCMLFSSTLYSFLNVKELPAESRHDIWSLSDSNGFQTHNHVVCKLANLVSRFPCNARVIVDASSNPPVSNVKSL